jgi:hypothetical protein
VKSVRRSGFTLDLGEELGSKLTAFCATYYVKTKHEVIREALIAHMEAVLDADRERRLRYQRFLSGGQARRRSPKGRTGRAEDL